ncbi:MAG: TIGR03067 domain-containing protein [Gemmataceae bacterium]
MRFRIFSFALSLCFFAAPHVQGGGPSGELNKMQGQWVVSEMKIDGVTLPQEKLKNMLVVIDTNKMQIIPNIRIRSIPRNFSLKLGKDGSLQTIDMQFIVEEGPDGRKPKPRVLLGIYELNDKTFRICTANNPSDLRPTEMTSLKGRNQALLTLTRKPPAKKTMPKKKTKDDKKK